MRLVELEAALSEISQPVLSVYLDANPKGSSVRATNVNSLPWLKKLAKSLAARMPTAARVAFQIQLDRVETFLRSSAPRNGGMVVFSGPKTWVCVLLPSPVSNALYWGKPAVEQLRRIASEQQNVCIVVVDRAGARFFRHELGEISEMPAMKFELDVSQWKQKEHGHMARRNTKMPHGPLRDAFKQRMDQQYQRFFRHIAERTKFVCGKDDPPVVLLVGSERLTKPIESALPLDIQERTVLIDEDLARISPAKLQAKILPRLADWTTRFAEARANRLLESEHAAVFGVDETLAQLQDGRLGSLLIVRGLDAALRQCAKCGDINRSADPVCVRCGGARQAVTLSQVLYDLAKNRHTKVEVLDPDGAKKLAKAGGLGGWLRQPMLVAAR
jgi:hypothetical protein